MPLRNDRLAWKSAFTPNTAKRAKYFNPHHQQVHSAEWRDNQEPSVWIVIQTIQTLSLYLVTALFFFLSFFKEEAVVIYVVSQKRFKKSTKIQLEACLVPEVRRCPQVLFSSFLVVLWKGGESEISDVTEEYSLAKGDTNATIYTPTSKRENPSSLNIGAL